MGVLSVAIKREDWRAAAYLLLIGLAKVAPTLPPEALSELLELLESPDGRGQGCRGGR
ncbi:MAG: hypothetical protein HYY31_02330 [Chloroflexi bacterium]|nr:hypothetical protein [Chloroflexota bacterium]